MYIVDLKSQLWLRTTWCFNYIMYLKYQHKRAVTVTWLRMAVWKTLAEYGRLLVEYLLGILLLHQKNLLACCPCIHHCSQHPSSQCKETWSSWLWHVASHLPSHTPCSSSLVLSRESAPQWHPQTAVVYHGYKIGCNPALLVKLKDH